MASVTIDGLAVGGGCEVSGTAVRLRRMRRRYWSLIRFDFAN